MSTLVARPNFTLASIWAQDRNGILGTGTSMLWHVPADFAHFKQMTLGYPIIMGRSSYEALGGQPLPGRTNIVMTRQRDYETPGALVVANLDEALEVATAHLADHRDQRAAITASTATTSDMDRDPAPVVWITGGAQIYEQTMDRVDELVVTDLDLDVRPLSGQNTPLVYAPHVDPEHWHVDPDRSDSSWRDVSGDARWRITTFVRPSHR